MAADFLRLIESSCLARADGPDWLIGNDQLRDFLRLEAGQGFQHLESHIVEIGAALADLQRLTAANNRRNAGCKSGMGTLVYALVGLAEIVAALAVTQDAVVNANLGQHLRGDFAGESTVILPMDILGTYMDVRALGLSRDSGQSRRCGADHHIHLGILHQGSQVFHKLRALGDGVVHFPVASNNRSPCHFQHLPLLF